MPVPLRHSASAKKPLMRPKGLWKARGTLASPLADHCHQQPIVRESKFPAEESIKHDNEDIEYHTDSSSASSSRRKRRRIQTETPPASDNEEVFYWDYSRRCSPHPHRLNKWSTRTKLMDTSSTAYAGLQPPAVPSASDLDDWEDLKELFAKAVELFETQEPSETIPLLRGVIHECHRIMRAYPDPSLLVAPRQPSRPTTPHHPAPQRTDYFPPAALKKDQGIPKSSSSSAHDHQHTHKSYSSFTGSGTEEKEKKCKCVDLPTAFHTLLGTTLFLFGNLVGQDPDLVVEGEPNSPMPYWLLAIDIFELGENLPIRTSGRTKVSAPEDWRMAIVWGRTLVCIADEILTRHKEQQDSPVPPQPPQPSSYGFTDAHGAIMGVNFGLDLGLEGYGSGPTLGSVSSPTDDPDWPLQSPFALIKSNRTSIMSGRPTLAASTSHDLMIQAQDQFTRGIFHMPHPQHAQKGAARFHLFRGHLTGTNTASSSGTVTPSATSSSKPATTPPTSTSSRPTPAVVNPNSFSRSKELFTIASEVLLLSEKLPQAAHRAQWALWADSVLSQMKMELSSSSDPLPAQAWKGILTSTRGRCNLVAGGAKSEELEDALEKGEMDVLGEERAEDARAALKAAIEYFEAAKEFFEEKAERRRAEAGGSGASQIPIVEQGGEEEDESMHLSHDEDDASDGSPSEPVAGGSAPARSRRVKFINAPKPDAADEEEELEELTGLLAEALVTLANLTVDVTAREELYKQAKAVGGDMFDLDEEDRMDESG